MHICTHLSIVSIARSFQEHVASHAPNKVLEIDEFLALRKEVKHMLKHERGGDADGSGAENPDAPPGEDDDKETAAVSSTTRTRVTRPDSAGPFSFQSTDEETKAIRERIVSIRRKIHKSTVNAVTSRWNFEEAVSGSFSLTRRCPEGDDLTSLFCCFE